MSIFSFTYQDYSDGSTPFGEIAHPTPAAYNRPTLVQIFSVRFRVEHGRQCLPGEGLVKGKLPGLCESDATSRSC